MSASGTQSSKPSVNLPDLLEHVGLPAWVVARDDVAAGLAGSRRWPS